MNQQELHDKIENWVNNLKSGDGDYKKLYTENLMELYIITGCAGIADQQLLTDMKEMVKNYE